MDPASSPLNQNQKDRLNSILSTPVTPGTNATATKPDESKPNDSINASPPTPPTTPNSSLGGSSPVTPNSLGLSSPSQPASVPSIGQPSSPLGSSTPTPASTYQVPTVGMPPETPAAAPSVGTPGIGTMPTATATTPQPELKPSTNKPMKIKSEFPMMTLLYVVGGIVLLLVYTIIWAVVFDLKLPFGITLPF